MPSIAQVTIRWPWVVCSKEEESEDKLSFTGEGSKMAGAMRQDEGGFEWERGSWGVKLVDDRVIEGVEGWGDDSGKDKTGRVWEVWVGGEYYGWYNGWEGGSRSMFRIGEDSGRVIGEAEVDSLNGIHFSSNSTWREWKLRPVNISRHLYPC